MKASSVLVATAAVLAAGCYHHSFTVGTGGNTDGDAKYSHWQSHWFYGIFGEEDVKVKEVCPSGNATIKDYHSFLNGLVGAFIGVIWYPTTVEIYCDGGKSATLTLSPEAMRAFGRSAPVVESARSFDPDLAEELVAARKAFDSNPPAHVAREIAPISAY